jgi:predicted enzyme related to lactoylglutathione lyase
VTSHLDATEVTVGVPVRDLSKARAWYAQLFGRPPDLEPVPGVVEFKVGGWWLQLEEGTPGGAWAFRIGVADLDAARELVGTMGVKAGKVVTVPGVIRLFDFRDPDGNLLSFYQLLASNRE